MGHSASLRSLRAAFGRLVAWRAIRAHASPGPLRIRSCASRQYGGSPGVHREGRALRRGRARDMFISL
ncbi:hypothetical protein ppKF707_3271 [Metapseudomonas furukawaii]|uniref:Uncharacterized protein n=1 Tax=Metapseudomonas furukawaii TaxID=1149133 RepID=A0AAD1BW17_METFU|nr:hypothetical protein ppKF707_3271 [Pseudomonas furukawaii]BAU71976.1 hypothetical protein KF707C_2880 [Pseudomonas furukawaii]